MQHSNRATRMMINRPHSGQRSPAIFKVCLDWQRGHARFTSEAVSPCATGRETARALSRSITTIASNPHTVARAEAAANPYRIIICPCGMDLSATRVAAQNLLSQPWFQELRAVRAG